jgi:hypothetical protein
MIITRNDVITQLEQYLAGAISAEHLAGWAFDRFYAIDQGANSVEPADADVIADTFDELMFADAAPFALTPGDVQRLIARLQHA